MPSFTIIGLSISLGCFDIALKFIKEKKILGFINCPVSKESLFKNKHQGITEFLSKKVGEKCNEVMLIYNKKLSVSPITTHIPLSQVTRKINKNIIEKKIKIINTFYKKTFNKKPNFAILGLNPHNFSTLKNNKKKKIIENSIRNLSKKGIKVFGPLSPDSSFIIYKKYKFDVIIGMYMIKFLPLSRLFIIIMQLMLL